MPDGGLDATTNWAKNLAEGAAAASSENPEETSLITLGEVALYIFTSGDRKSTRLNSSHGYISYAVFCLKKKQQKTKKNKEKMDGENKKGSERI